MADFTLDEVEVIVRKLRTIDLFKANLRGVNLRNGDLSGAILCRVLLYKANLSAANLCASAKIDTVRTAGCLSVDSE